VTEEIGIKLVGEGTDVWVFVPAERVAEGRYRILPSEIEDQQVCRLEFKPGAVVRTAPRAFSSGETRLTAIALLKGDALG
jgi:hypothetical protein